MEIMVICHLNKLIKNSNYTQKEISNKLDINQNTISNYVNNKFTAINVNHIDKLCSLFECNTSDLFQYMTDKEYEKYIEDLNAYNMMHSYSLFTGASKLAEAYKPKYLNQHTMNDKEIEQYREYLKLAYYEQMFDEDITNDKKFELMHKISNVSKSFLNNIDEETHLTTSDDKLIIADSEMQDMKDQLATLTELVNGLLDNVNHTLECVKKKLPE